MASLYCLSIIRLPLLFLLQPPLSLLWVSIPSLSSRSSLMGAYMCIHMYAYVCICMCVSMYVKIHIKSPFNKFEVYVYTGYFVIY